MRQKNKLSNIDAKNVKLAVASGLSQESVALMYNVSQGVVSQCVRDRYQATAPKEVQAEVVNDLIAEVHKKHDSLIRTIAAGFSSEHSQDIVQETYVRLITGAAGFNCDRAELVTWVGVVARSVGADYLRTGQYKMGEMGDALSHLEEDAPEDEDHDMFDLSALSDSSYDPYEVMVAESTAAMLNDALGKLTTLQCHCYTMREVDGMTYEDIADELGITSGAARVYVSRAQSILLKLVRR